MLPAHGSEPKATLTWNTPPASKPSAGHNSLLQGVRVILSACVIVSHLYVGVIVHEIHSLGWVAVNGFFVMSGWLAYESLHRTWSALEEQQNGSLRVFGLSSTTGHATLPSRPGNTCVLPSPRAGGFIDVEYEGTPRPKVLKDEQKRAFQHMIHLRKRYKQLRLLCRHVIEYISRRLLPFIWIMILLVLAMKSTQTFRKRVSIKRNLFTFNNSPIFNFWTVHLRSLDTGARAYWANPPVWYMSCLSLYTILAPFAYHLIRFMKRIPIGSAQVKLSIYAILPFILIVLDYFYVRMRLDQTVLHSPSPHPDIPIFALQVSPEGYVNKFIIPMVANALWSDIGEFIKVMDSSVPSLARVLISYFPVIDCLVIGQALVWFLTPRVPRSIYWTSIYISIFLPIHCLICWAAMNNIGANFIFSRILRSRWLNKIAPGYMTLFIYLLHVPLTEIVNHKPRIAIGVVWGLLVLFYVSLHAANLHTRVMKRYDRLMAKLFPKCE